ncbi:MAG: toxin-antitoxin system HicB family antitoxin [Gemmobacter sp.]|nr:toxin-antitoxin system HicB family antitoxin [Gemmobacter sp.]
MQGCAAANQGGYSRGSHDIHRKAARAAELSGKSLNPWAEEVLERAAG